MELHLNIQTYIFSQRKQKVNPIDNEADDTVSFNYWNVYRFNPKLSSPLTGDETITMLNLVLVVRYDSVHFLLFHIART